MPSHGLRLAAAGIVALLPALPGAAQTSPSLGTAASFAVLGGTAVENSGPTRITGNVGVSPGKSIGGFPPGTVVVGDIFVDDVTARQAQRDSAATYAALGALSCTPLMTASPVPGTYCVTSPLPATLTLIGNAASVWTFQATGSLVTPDDSSVLLRGGATYNNVFWQVNGSATLGARSAFVGTILARADITLKRDVSVSGRAISQTGVVILDTDDVSCCDPIEFAPAWLPAPKTGEPYNQTITLSGGVPPYTMTLFDGTLPPGLTLTANGMLSGTPAANGDSMFTVLAVDARGCSAIHTYSNCTLVVTFDPKPDAKACEPFDRMIGVTGGMEPYTFSAKGPLPPGLAPPTDQDRRIHGTPSESAPGDYTVTIDVIDALGCRGSLTFTLHVACGLMLPPLNPSTATAGELYTANIAPNCGTRSLTYTAADGFPSWLSPPKEGIISGTPPAPGSVGFTVTVLDNETKCTDARTYALPIFCAQTAVAPPLVLPTGAVCNPYVSGPIAGTVVDPASLPPGLIVNGRLQGVPKKSGTFRFTMKLDDVSPAPPCPLLQDYIIKIECPPLALPPLDLLRGCVPMSQSLVPAFCLPFAWSYTGTLPNGLAFNDAGFPGILHGTPQPGDFDFTVVGVAGDSGCGATAHYTGTVTACATACSSPITGLPPSSNLAGGTVAFPYNPGLTQTFTATGGTAPYKFFVAVPSSLPPGLGVSQSGILSGIPTTPGRFNFAIKAVDATGASGCFVVYTIIVGPLPPPVVDIPVLPPWAMLLLSAALAVVAIAAIRRTS